MSKNLSLRDQMYTACAVSRQAKRFSLENPTTQKREEGRSQSGQRPRGATQRAESDRRTD
ncbi:hypothetical protein BJY00DRAFT_280265 [Aspergillus carlsbadensis]|nr:hypothetical protein BJY00DRAFT_280265 [Aspergillus carlsbadensis]